jgi:hypothetical protein
LTDISEQVLAGVIGYQSDDLRTTARNYFKMFASLTSDGVPNALTLAPMVVNSPMGRLFSVLFVWSSADRQLGQTYLDRVAAASQVVFNGVMEQTIPEWHNQMAHIVPKAAYGNSTTLSIYEMTDEVTDVMLNFFEQLPSDPCAMFTLHQSRATSETSTKGSVFASRKAHFMLEFLGCASTPEAAEATWGWAQRFKQSLAKTAADNIAESTYISTVPPREVTMEKVYGMHWSTILRVKRQYDPRNIFKYALPRIEL